MLEDTPSFAVQTTERLMQLRELLQCVKEIRTEVETTETLTNDVKDLLDTYETINDTMMQMLIKTNEFVIGQDDLLNDILDNIEIQNQ